MAGRKTSCPPRGRQVAGPAIIPQRHRVARSCTIAGAAIANARLGGRATCEEFEEFAVAKADTCVQDRHEAGVWFATARGCAAAWRSRGRDGRLVGAGAVAGGFTAQGIYPGNPGADAFRLPYDFEPVIRPRMFYKKTETLTEAEQQAWVLGGFAGLRSPWFGDLFQFGVVGYTSQKLYGPAGEGGTLLLQAGPVVDLLSSAKPSARSASRARRSPATGNSSTGRSSIRRTTAKFPIRSRLTR